MSEARTRLERRKAWGDELRATLSLGWPLILVNLAQNATTTTDVILMGRLGADALAAGALGTNLYFAFLIFGIGVVTATAPMLAQELGRNRHAVRELRRTVRQGFWAALAVSVPMWAVLWHADALLRLIGQEPALAAAAASYVRALMWAILPFLCFLVLRSFLSALERPLWTLVVSAGSVPVNAVLAYGLIFGRFGLPELGLAGGGVATTLSSTLMLLGLAAVIVADRRFRRYRLFGRWWRADPSRLRALWRLGLPIGATLAFEVTIFNAAAFVMGLIGAASLAAHAVALQIASLSFMVPLGLSQAVTVRVGRAYGAGDHAGVLRAGWTSYALGVGFMAVMALVLVAVPHALVGVFLDRGDSRNAAVIELAVTFLAFAALFQVVDGAQAVGAGMLRGLSDTRVPMIYAAAGYWGVGAPLGVALAFGTEGATAREASKRTVRSISNGSERRGLTRPAFAVAFGRLRAKSGSAAPTGRESRMIDLAASAADALPADAASTALAGRVWRPEVDGPSVVALRDGVAVDVSRRFPTMRDLCEAPDPARALRETDGETLGPLDAILANTPPERRDGAKPWLLAPIDLQAVKAAGVTFAVSMLERVIEERARGNPDAASAIRSEVGRLIGGDLSRLRPGSDEAMALKKVLVAQGAWSQYLEVGIGPDAEIFTKAPPMSAVGTGVDAGLHPNSSWNNPEPEVVLAVASTGAIVAATLGNDVNLRDVEGRSALLLGKAKDNNASAAIGPFLRFFDDDFTLDDVRSMTVTLTVEGPDGFRLEGSSSLSQISRDPADLVGQMIGPHHQYPDGAVLFLGTMFAPVEDRGEPGKGFTHQVGDIVAVATPRLGRLVNRMRLTDQCEPWTFGAGALMRNLARRGLL